MSKIQTSAGAAGEKTSKADVLAAKIQALSGKATINVEEEIANIIEIIESEMKAYEVLIENDMIRPSDRRRRIGAGIRNYGFMDKTSDLALANPQFNPAGFDPAELKLIMRKLELCRNLLALLQNFTRAVSDDLLTLGNQGFSLALLYYNSVRELARRNDTGAQTIFNMLRPYFRRPNPENAKPTEPEVERDVRALLKGKKDGKIVIENEKPHLTGGKHIVVDEKLTPKGAWKETEKGQID